MATEKRLIDANALSESVSGIGKNIKRPRAVELACLVRINEAPTVDAVEVVRCKDCKHFGGYGACHCHAADENGTPIFVRENDFCSYGERRC